MNYTDSPDYLKSADLHNLGAGTPSFFQDPLAAVEGAVSSVGNFALKTPVFVGVSIASGINSIYNSAIVAGNWLRITDEKENDLRRTLGEFDSDLGKYYSAHKDATDLAGFVATSLIPGLGGVKIFNAGQAVLKTSLKAGVIGRTMAESTGLPVTLTSAGKTLTEIAGEALAQGNQTFTVMNAGVLKAIGAGVGQATLESAAFETMVAATMFRSPILEQMDIHDLGVNILTGAALGGAIGGIINAAHVYGGVKKIISAQDLVDKEQTLRLSQGGLEKQPATRIILNRYEQDTTKPALTPRAETLRDQRLRSLDNETVLAAHELAGSSPGVGTILMGMIRSADSNRVAQLFQGMIKVAHPLDELKLAKKTETGGLVKVHGEDIGDITFESVNPNHLTLADRLPNKDAIIAAVRRENFSTEKLWTPVKAKGMDEVDARYIWAQKNAIYKDGMEIHVDDIPLQEGALSKGLNTITLVSDAGEKVIVSAKQLSEDIVANKLSLATKMAAPLPDSKAWKPIKSELGLEDDTPGITSREIARIANVSHKFLEGEASASQFYRQDAQKAYSDMRKAKGIIDGEEDISYVPSALKVAYKNSQLVTAKPDLTTTMVYIEHRRKIVKEAVDKAFAGVTGELYERFVHPGADAILNANRYGAGAGSISFANGAYGTLASWSELIGKATSEFQQALGKRSSDVLDSVLLRLRNDQAAAIEFDKVNNLVSSTTEKYVLNEAGDGLVAQAVMDYRLRLNEGKTAVPFILQPGAPDEIMFTHDLTGEAIRARIYTNGYRVNHSNNLRRAMGLESSRKAEHYYPLKAQPRDYPYFAFVKDNTVTGAGVGHTSMIHANTAEQLEEMMKAVRSDGRFKTYVYTKGEAEEYYKVRDAYEFDRTLHDNYIDSALKSMGVNNNYFPKTNPSAIVDNWLELERRANDTLAREAVGAKYMHEFDQLESLGSQYTNTAASRYGVTAKQVEGTIKNPYNDYRKTALNISRLSEHPLLTGFNRYLEKAVDGVYQKVKDVWSQSSSINDLEKVNEALQEAGIEHAYKSSAEILLANHTAPKAYLSNFIRGANAILANTFLRLDPLNALNNSIGTQVLLGHETSAELRRLTKEVAGITVPGTSDKILSSASLVANAIKDWHSGPPELTAFFKKNGWSTRLADQYRSMTQDLTLMGNETPAQLNSKLQQAWAKAKEFTTELVDAGERVTFNKGAEELNRYIAAHVGHQLSELAIKNGLMEASGKLAYINTFVNRTQGNVLASQRPLIFQGPIGQAIGLFQTFQFNTMQQLFRSVSEGSAKDAAMMMGLQATFYGLNGLPAFQFINQHIIGTASGNKNHTDAYSLTYGAAGKTAGDWLLYGIPSNILQTNLYSRGDVNPRTLTVVPLNPADVVAVSAFAKFAANIKETFTKMAGGGDLWQTFLQGLEHNTLSRPLAGLAQTLQATTSTGNKVFSTTNAGDISFVNDFMSLATLSRLAGGKPLDEALANDEVSRSMVYKAADRERMMTATETFKTNVIGTTNPQGIDTAVNSYITSFVHNGGQREEFNKTMLNAMTRVNTPRANAVITSLKGPYAEHMKSMMGGSVEGLDTDPAVP